MVSHADGYPPRVAFLLAQLGAHVSVRFSARVGELGLTPGEAAVLRLVGRTPGLSQRAIADRVRTMPSRIVGLVDGLEQRGLLTRTRSSLDRRNYELHLTEEGRSTLAALRRVAQTHEAEICDGLSDDQVRHLAITLQALAHAHQLDPDLHSDTGLSSAAASTEADA